MYIPKLHQETNLAVLHGLIRAHPLGAWVTQAEGELVANHMPFLLDPERGPHGTLMCHVARANPVWRTFSTSLDSLVIFEGSDAYITPSWYASKQEHGKVVPTWNYAVVHAHGRPTPIDDPAWLLPHLTRMTQTHEARETKAWKVSDAPADFVERLMTTIVGIEIPITKLEGKWKVSQNRPEADRRGVVEGLLGRGDAASLDMAALVQGTRA